MKNVPTKDDDLDDFDEDDWGGSVVNQKGPNPMVRQQVNAMRPMTSGKPGQRGFHGIGRKPQGGGGARADADELDDMLDGMGLGDHDPLTAIN